ncbi:hypothetical protein V5O48_014320 [Marasmius crinis-equi]|uniref:Uncharacterized protein n=1 Tax=Marasmius crinis-equi TaxID=585013 RepID=A0ABR3EXN0_9AGAR
MKVEGGSPRASKERQPKLVVGRLAEGPKSKNKRFPAFEVKVLALSEMFERYTTHKSKRPVHEEHKLCISSTLHIIRTRITFKSGRPPSYNLDPTAAGKALAEPREHPSTRFWSWVLGRQVSSGALRDLFRKFTQLNPFGAERKSAELVRPRKRLRASVCTLQTDSACRTISSASSRRMSTHGQARISSTGTVATLQHSELVSPNEKPILLTSLYHNSPPMLKCIQVTANSERRRWIRKGENVVEALHAIGGWSARKNILPPSPTLISVTSSKDEEDGYTLEYDLGVFFVPEPPAESLHDAISRPNRTHTLS